MKTSPKSNKMTLSFDLRLIALLLAAVIVGMLFLWQPWVAKDPDSKNRTVTVTGETTITAVPDEFVFSPSYQFKNVDKAAALAQVTKKSDEVVKKLKELGVPDNKIKSDSNGNNYSYYYDDSGDQNNYSLQLTVTVNNKDLVQKVQDYLVTTTPSGAISPQASFSDKSRKELENKARDEAAKDARAKAERTAKNIGFTVGKVKNISDNNNGISPIVFGERSGILSAEDANKQPSLSVQPGENDLPYSITVVYYVKD